MRLLRIFLVLFLAVVFTTLTQIGGVLFLLSLLSHRFIRKRFHAQGTRMGLKILSFFVIYFAATLWIVPPLAKIGGRVPLPFRETGHLQPATVWTFLLNRNYVRPSLREAALLVSGKLHAKFPGTIVNYLDANFPFMDKFPMAPHISHSDGRKLDLSFPYRDVVTGQITNEVPSFIGYGICESPKPGEINMPDICDRKGFWQYSLLPTLISQRKKDLFQLDNQRTKALIDLLVSEPAIGKIFIEPHLKWRLDLTSEKVRFHGCQAVRHDDHIHVQMH